MQETGLKEKIQTITNFLKGNLSSMEISDFRDDERMGHCFKIKNQNLACKIFFSDEFLDDRMNRDIHIFLEGDGGTILDAIRSGHGEVKVMNIGIELE